MKRRTILFFGIALLGWVLMGSGSVQADWPQLAKLTADDGAAEDQFGFSVSVCGDYALVGALFDNDKGTNSGSAYVFKWDGTKVVPQCNSCPKKGSSIKDVEKIDK